MRLRRILKITLLVIVLVVAAAAALVISIFSGKVSIPDGLRFNGVEVVKDGYVSVYILDLRPGEVALVDGGNDVQAKAILKALWARGLGPKAVKAIILTHGDLDHVRGVPVFPDAIVMALGHDVDLAEGRRGRGPMQPRPTGFHVGRSLADGDVLELANVRMEVFALPGHTPGSLALLARGVLFLGDSADVTTSRNLIPANWFFCHDGSANRSSLQRLVVRLQARASEVQAVACSHSGVLDQGLAPLSNLAEQLSKKGNP